ncbi:MAG TPA: hypothetical protein VEG60_12965 [Candidatus Binatia bacterium]|nr:hypothetical protein [Candidatus Binatia bacterium]
MYGLGEPVGRKFLSSTSVLGFFYEASAYGGKLHPKPDGVKEASDLLMVLTEDFTRFLNELDKEGFFKELSK